MLKWSCKKIFAGIAIISLAGNIFPVMPTVSAKNLPSYYERTPSEREKALLSARDFAYQYLKNSSEEPFWKNKFPYISGEKFFYTANDDIPSYIEFKISTSESNDAGFIIVNLDGNDVEVPIASPSGKTPSEALNIRFNKNHNTDGNEKLYYFSPFDQWIVDENGNAETLNPNNQENEVVKNNSETSLRSAESGNNENVAKILTEEWKQKQNEKFAEIKKDVENFVESEIFKRKIIELRSENRTYKFPWVGANKLLSWYRGHDCAGSLPCYDQFERKFWNWWSSNKCQSWCVPVAMAIVMGYHARNSYPKLLQWKNTPLVRNSTINNLITRLWDEMWTYCAWNEWITSSEDFHKAIKIFNETWYNFKLESKGPTSPYQVYLRTKQAIDNKRPLIVGISFNDPNKTPHVVVAFGYHDQYQMIRINMWYGKDNLYWNYYWSNLNVMVGSMSFTWDESWRANAFYDFIP